MSEIEKLRKVAEAVCEADREFHSPCTDSRRSRERLSALYYRIDALRAALDAPVEAAPTPPMIYQQGFAAGSEWQREQAAREVDAWIGTDADPALLASMVRSLPVSPPAPEEAK
ncbi:MAG: hypothetical protein IPO00_08785 [Betaproteobacteria bacterium]|nr:hypothetical protein [Betaproteobacteria bacterium]